MDAIEIKHNDQISNIFVEKSLERLGSLLPSSNIIVLIDENVNRLYGNLFSQFKLISIRSGEPEKTLDTVAGIYGQLIELEADRHTFILGVGGGIVCDMAGFIASTYMRGLRFGFIPTTLMAQADASIGGKNGVNFHRFKNMIGTINQPEFVLADVRFLSTLPLRELNAGFAEIIKYGLISDKSILDDFDLNINQYLKVDTDELAKLIFKCASIKANIVNMDAREQGLRKILNFGHTIGHAIERISSDHNHGEGVSMGMVAAMKISQVKGDISIAETDRVCSLLLKLYLPVSIGRQLFPGIIESLRADKKRNQQFIDYIILKRLGTAEIIQMTFAELSALLLNMKL